MKVGYIDIDCALEMVDSPELRIEMEKAWVDIQKNKIFAISFCEACLSVPLRRVAIQCMMQEEADWSAPIATRRGLNPG